jgi:hypothetical protein
MAAEPLPDPPWVPEDYVPAQPVPEVIQQLTAPEIPGALLWVYGDCGYGVTEQGWEHGPMALPVVPLDGCER